MNIAEKTLQLKEDFDEVYEAGKQKEWNDFWDSVPLGGLNQLAFSGYVWNDTTFRPNRDIVFLAGSGSYSFASNNISNIKERLNECGVKLDVSQMTSFSYCFRYLMTKELPELDFSSTQYFSGLGYSVSNNSNLETIDKIILPTNWKTEVTNAANFLTANPKLKNIAFEGVIPGSINVSSSPLSVKSLKSIITHLKDYAGTSSKNAYTITFKSSAFAELENEGATAEYNGTACTWRELIDNLKWNLVLS